MKPGVVPSERLGAASSTVWMLRRRKALSPYVLSLVLGTKCTADCCAKSGERGQAGTTAAKYGDTADCKADAGLCT